MEDAALLTMIIRVLSYSNVLVSNKVLEPDVRKDVKQLLPLVCVTSILIPSREKTPVS